MTALAQGSAGLALVMCFALLRTSQVSAAAILLAIQSGAVAITAAVLHRPLIAIPPLALAAGIWACWTWLIGHQTLMLDPRTAPLGGAKLGIGVGAVMAILCQSQGSLALPSAIILLSILLAATRSHPLMQVMALVGAQNGLALAGCFVAQSVLLPAALLGPLASLLLPLPLAAGLLVPVVAALPSRDERDHEASNVAKFWMAFLNGMARWFRWFDLGWFDLALALAIFAATLIVPVDSLASVFAPLLGLDGVLRACVRRNRRALTLVRRGTALAQTALMVLAVCAPNLIIAWLMVLGAMAMAMLPVVSRRWNNAVLGFLAAGLALFGMLLLSSGPSIVGYFSLFAGFATIGAVVPDLAVVVVILILRLGTQTTWQPGAEMLGIAIAVAALLGCATLLINPALARASNDPARRGSAGMAPHRTTVLLLSQASIAALAVCTGQADGRFAALVLLILLILTRSAARVMDGPARTLALAGMGGVPPLGVFPGLVLVVLVVSAHEPWLLLPVGVALIPIVWASIPSDLPKLSPRLAIPSIAWLPLVLATVAGYFAPASLVHWWRILMVGAT